MRTQMVVGVFLVVIGVAILVFGGFTDTTTREEVKIGLQIPPPLAYSVAR